MKIYFTETESAERSFFERQLSDHELHFVSDLSEVGEDAEVLSTFIYSEVGADFLNTHPNLRLVVTRSSTLDHIDLNECERHGITVSYVVSYGDHTVAEHTFALLMALARRLRETMKLSRKSKLSLEQMQVMELYDKTFGIIGAGRIGQRTVPIAKAFGMNVIAYDIRRDPDAEKQLGFRYVDLDDLLTHSDIVSLHASLNAGSYHIMDQEAFQKCRPGMILINTARGALIDTRAVVEALDNGTVGALGVDVLEDERVLRQEVFDVIGAQILKKLSVGESDTEGSERRLQELHDLVLNESLIARDNVIFTPHVAYNSQEACLRMRQITLENIRAFEAGKPSNVVTKHWLNTVS